MNFLMKMNQNNITKVNIEKFYSIFIIGLSNINFKGDDRCRVSLSKFFH